ncbi:MAG: DUF58 domain-containing protein [Ignavibacteria bacterium]|nr:DUF58 domain-containing protein [Ignavibacteria bacterium]
METDYRKYLEPSVISRLSNIELKAKLVVEGFIAGLHQSPYHGFSVEFTEHRPYMPGDDLKYLDWKVLGRTDRYYIKQFEEETNLKSYLIIDASRSMSFRSDSIDTSPLSSFRNFFRKKSQARPYSYKPVISKLEYSSYLAASIAMLMHFQKDASGLVIYDEKIRTFIPPKATSQNLKQILLQLSGIIPSGKTNTSESLNEVAEKIKRRGLVIIFSDLFDEQKKVIKAIRHFRYKKNEVIVFHILDPLELNLLTDTPLTIRDMESGQELQAQPLAVINSYREALQEFIDNYKTACFSDNTDYVLISTNTPFDKALFEYLNKRKTLH